MKLFLSKLLLLLFFFVVPRSAWAQFSPGPLTQGHAELEGIENCTQCHDVGEKINGGKCLACHLELKARIDAGKGYHVSSNVKSQECIACHFDHKGRTFHPIKWESTKEKFNHDLAGYKLEGKHKTDRCEKCHRPEQIRDALVLKQKDKSVSLTNTFLGLSQDCRTCHFDEHRNQFDDQRCISCHDLEDWNKSAKVKFDHNKSNYPLTGMHAPVGCVKCHKPVPDFKKKRSGDADLDYAQYKNLDFKYCTPCHNDVHNNKFGQDCQSCHKTDSWHSIGNLKFDHVKTNYPLAGKHQRVVCEKCHQPDLNKAAVFKNMKFAACTDCHADSHSGQFTHRADKGKCEACHDLAGFVPSLFTIERHNQESPYKLLGAHQKTKCGSCHIKVAPKEFHDRSGFNAIGDSAAMLFTFRDQKCSVCHKDIHRGQFTDKLQKSDCEFCHKAESWKDLKFDHTKDSEFSLLGKHKEQKCERCHKFIDENTEFKRVVYKPLSKFCESCHKDIHEGQLKKHKEITTAHPMTTCEDCHNNEVFKPAMFNHNKQSGFALTGAHQKADCLKCHIKTIILSDTLNVLYKPISAECASCHPDQHEGEFEIK